MATIQLVNISRIFTRPAPTRPGAENGTENGAAAFTGPIRALDQVNLTIPDGTTLAVLGPSGCGKSTLLRVIAGLDREYQGSVLYDGRPMEDVPPKERHIGMVFQNYALYPHFLGHGNLAFFFRLRRTPDQETEERIRITSEIMGIGFRQLLGRKPGTLSGGEQQRLAIGRAIVRNPRLFLLDEPLSNLDARLRAQTRMEIKRLLRQFGITAVYVTHDQNEAFTLGDQIAVMRQGRVEQVGDYATLREKPASTFVASFLGSHPMNLVPGGLVSDGMLTIAGQRIPLPPWVQNQVSPGQALTLGARPEAACWKKIGGGLALQGVVEVLEPDFAQRTQVVYLRVGSRLVAAAATMDDFLLLGQEVTVYFPQEALFWFDEASGRRLAP